MAVVAIPLVVGKVLAVVGTFLAVRLVIQVLLAFGIGWAVFTGITTMLDAAEAQMQSTINSSGVEQVTAILGLMRIDDAISLIFAAMAIRAAIRGLNSSGSIRKLVFGGGE